MSDEMPKAHKDVLAERRRQIEGEGFTLAHDDEHTAGEMALVAALYASPIPLYRGDVGARHVHFQDPWPRQWGEEWDRRRTIGDRHAIYGNSLLDLAGRRALLVKAGALILAEIERLDRLPEDGKGAAHG